MKSKLFFRINFFKHDHLTSNSTLVKPVLQNVYSKSYFSKVYFLQDILAKLLVLYHVWGHIFFVGQYIRP
jgi:hypothetical protein